MRPFGVALRRQRQGLLVEARRVHEGVESNGAPSGVTQRRACATRQPADVETDQTCVLEGAHVVVREKLGPVLRPHARLEPLGGPLVPLSSGRAGDLPIRDVAHEDVPERVLLIALDRGAPVTSHELLAFERAQRVVHALGRTARAEQRAAPKHLSDDSGVLHQLLLRSRQCVKAG